MGTLTGLCSRLVPSRAALCGCLLPTALLLGAAVCLRAESPGQGIRVLYPAARSVHDGSVCFIVATPLAAPAPTGTLDGKRLAFSRLTFANTWATPGRLKATSAVLGERAASALWVAPADLSPGAHAAVIGGRKIEVRGLKGPVPAGWHRAYAHPPVGCGDAKPDCAGCHEQQGSVLGAAVTPGACEACHDEVSVQEVHRHVAGPLAKCAQCHDPHGAARPKLLVDAKEKLCSRCHESGHSKE